jgi:hypothetical protein
VRVVEIARLGRGDGREAWVRVGEAPERWAAEHGWLRRHLRRLRSGVDRRLYLWAFRQGWASARPISGKE